MLLAAESDTDSDHFPVIAALRLRLRGPVRIKIHASFQICLLYRSQQ